MLRFNHILSIVLLLICLLANSSCNRKMHHKSSEKKGDQETPGLPAPELSQNQEDLNLPEPAYLMLWLVKKPCYVECPAFDLKVYSDGRAFWRGEQHSGRIGYHEAFVPLGWRSQIMDRAKAIRFFSLQDKYPVDGPKLPDLPETIFYLNDGKQEKSITHQYLSPKDLIAFEKVVLDIVEGLFWEVGKEGEHK
jgi:Domain of unknown function (DUF6438)